LQFYAAANLPQAQMLAPTAETFRQFLEQQETFVFFVTVYVGAGLIANDRRANALQIYLSKPLSRTEYVFGKLAILVAFLLLVTWIPAIVLLLVQIAFAGTSRSSEQPVPVPGDHRLLLVEVIMVAAAMLALSSAVEQQPVRRDHVCGGHLFSSAVYGVLYLVTRSTSLRGSRSLRTCRRSAT